MEEIFNFKLLFVIKMLITLFTAILFLQSGFNKIFDFRGNQSYIQSVFAKTFLNKTSYVMFVVITILEVCSGLLCFFGLILRLTTSFEVFAIWGLTLSATSILCLFFGQRIAKDYAGAASLVSYFLLIVFGLFLFSLKG
jgi:putative oxidoreductase